MFGVECWKDNDRSANLMILLSGNNNFLFFPIACSFTQATCSRSFVSPVCASVYQSSCSVKPTIMFLYVIHRCALLSRKSRMSLWWCALFLLSDVFLFVSFVCDDFCKWLVPFFHPCASFTESWSSGQSSWTPFRQSVNSLHKPHSYFRYWCGPFHEACTRFPEAETPFHV